MKFNENKCHHLCRLEYGYQLWNPHLKKDVLLLENIQGGFTRHIVKVSHLSYRERLAAFEPLLPSEASWEVPHNLRVEYS